MCGLHIVPLLLFPMICCDCISTKTLLCYSSKNDGNQWNASAERRCRFSHWMAILLKPNLLHLPNQTTESQWSLSHCSSEDFEGAIRGALRKHGHILPAAVCVAQEYQKKYMQEGGRVVHYCKQSLRCFRWRFMVYANACLCQSMLQSQICHQRRKPGDQGCCQQAFLLWLFILCFMRACMNLNVLA